MTTTAAISQTSSSAPPQRGQAGVTADPVTGQDFLAALNRLAYSSVSVAVIAQDIRLPDTTKAADYHPEERAVEYDDERSGHARDGAVAAETTTPEDQARQTESRVPDAPDEDRNSAGKDEGAADTTGRSGDREAQGQPAAEAPVSPAANDFARNTGATAARQGAERTAAQPVQSPPAGTTDTEIPVPTQQQLRQASDASGKLPGAQITDPGAKDQLPQLAHTLSSRSAVVAQSDTAKGATLADASPKNLPGDAAASSLLSGAAQSSGQGGQKAKGNAKTGATTASAGVQNAATAQGAQAAGQQSQSQSAVPLPAQQQNLQNLQFGTANGGSASGQQAARADSFSLSGSGQSAPQFSLRDTGAPTAAKPTPPVPPRVVTNQVAVQIQKAFGQGSDKISIQLKPAELGRVEVKLDVGKDGRVSAVITADRADTLDLLQRDARILQNSLQHAGLQADGNSLSFELKGQNQAFGEEGNGPARSDGLADAGGEETTTAAAAQPNIISNDRIDIQI